MLLPGEREPKAEASHYVICLGADPRARSIPSLTEQKKAAPVGAALQGRLSAYDGRCEAKCASRWPKAWRMASDGAFTSAKASR